MSDFSIYSRRTNKLEGVKECAVVSTTELAQLRGKLASWDTLRPELQRFALKMEERLKANDHKGGWQDCEWWWLLDRLREEADELETLIDPDCYSDEERLVGIPQEAADIANFAMMIADAATIYLTRKAKETRQC